MKHVLVTAVSVAAVCSDSTLAQSPPAITPEYVLAGFKDSRERLHSGVFRCQGTLTDNNPDVGRLEGPVRLLCAFDHDNHKFRFDRTEPVRIPKPGVNAVKGPGDWTVGSLGGKYVKTSGHTVTWYTSDKSVVVRPVSFEAPVQVSPFDVRVVGLATLTDLRRFTPVSQLVSDLGKRLSGTRVRVSRLERSVVRLEWEEQFDNTLLEFDEEKGYVPTRLEVRFGKLDSQPMQEAFEATKVSWTTAGGVPVPLKLSVRTGADSGRHTTYDLTFAWEKVNEPLPPELFMTRSLGLPKGVVIASTDNESTIRLGKTGDLAPDPRLAVVETDPPPVPPTRQRPWWVWPAVLVVVVAVMSALAWRFRYR